MMPLAIHKKCGGFMYLDENCYRCGKCHRGYRCIGQEHYLDGIWDKIDSLGECAGVESPGTALYDFTDAVPCEADAEVALFSTEYAGLMLCERCYKRHQEAICCD